ncbi:sensor histidine kinase [Streptomyces sp. WAC06614]|uniref:sensor histidine kinase n=1 Tax=Streptomyces sp. WAC06614 TaxID=2487416 RepID=UPI00163B86AB|nr:ATP-binding protein [Streptomyces sp. WAC06614]
MRHDAGGPGGQAPAGQWPPVDPGSPGGKAVAAIFLDFDRRAQRLRSAFRLVLVAVMGLVAWTGTPSDEWPAQFALVGAYGLLSLVTLGRAWARPEVARSIPGAAPSAFVVVDVAAVTVIQFLSVGSYLSLGLLAFLPFLTATQPGRQALLLSVAAIAASGAVLSDPAFREQLGPGEAAAIVAMLGLLCVVAVVVSQVQQRRLAKVAALTVSRSLLLEDVVSAEARERRAVSESVHDGPLQTVLAARQDLGQARKAPDGGPQLVERAYGLLGDVARDLRQVSVTLHPEVLEEAGLAAAVRSLARTTAERAGLTLECTAELPHRYAFDPMLFATARELLGNVARHARATRLRVALRDTGTAVILEVQDDGVGLDPGLLSGRLAEGHIGLASQRTRVEALGGTMELLPVERGTRVRVTVPVTDRPASSDRAAGAPATEAP